MKLVLLLLLAANLAFLVYARYGSEFAAGEAHLLAQQLNPAAIRVLTPEQVAAPGARSGAKRIACLEWGTFAGAELARAQSALEALALGGSLSQRRVEDKAGFWVFMPPQGSLQGANQKVAELKRLGIEDYFIIREDAKYRFAISLGVFKTEEAARSRLEQLRARGVRSAQVGTRDLSAPKTAFLIRDVPEALAAKLEGIRQDFAGTEITECAGEGKRG